MLIYNYLKKNTNLHVLTKHQIWKDCGDTLPTNLEHDTSQLPKWFFNGIYMCTDIYKVHSPQKVQRTLTSPLHQEWGDDYKDKLAAECGTKSQLGWNLKASFPLKSLRSHKGLSVFTLRWPLLGSYYVDRSLIECLSTN